MIKRASFKACSFFIFIIGDKMKKYSIIAIFISAIIALLINNSPVAKEGAINGIKLCESVIIPSLLSILILTNLIIKSKCSIIFEKLFGWVSYYLFKLPKCTAPAIFFGLIGGYPSGAILSHNLYEQGLIDDEDLKRIMRINFSGGLAFIVTAIGQTKFESARLGFVLYLSSVLSSIIIGIINGFVCKKPKAVSKVLYNPLPLNDALISSVESATKSILIMSAYIIMFSSICAILPIPSYIMPIAEITNGMFESSIPLDYTAFFLAFGGLCVHFQIMSYLPSYIDFLVFRIINAISSFGIMKLYLLINPINDYVFSNQSSITAQLTQANAGFGIIMIIGCAVIIFDIENRRIKLR